MHALRGLSNVRDQGRVSGHLAAAYLSEEARKGFRHTSYDRNRPAGRLYMNTRGHATTADPGLVIPLRGISNESRGYPHECGISRARRSAHGAYCCYRIAHWRMRTFESVQSARVMHVSGLGAPLLSPSTDSSEGGTVGTVMLLDVVSCGVLITGLALFC